MGTIQTHGWVSLAVALLVSASVPAAAIEEPAYESGCQVEGMEIRRYASAWGASTVLPGEFEEAGNSGFRRLAGYIFGGNDEEERIAMTAPVAQTARAEGEGWDVRFFLPRERTGDDLPAPSSDDVAIEPIPARIVAVHRFSGTWSEPRFLEKEEELRARLRESGLPDDGTATWARFDPPWTLWFLRRNEIWVELPDALPGPACEWAPSAPEAAGSR